MKASELGEIRTTEKERFELLKNFLIEHFDFVELKKSGFFDKTIKKNDYQKQADRICEYFGYKTIYQYGFKTIYAHISSVHKCEPFITELKAWHE